MAAITEEQVRTALRTVLDPEIGINVVDLGLVYNIAIKDCDVSVTMTMTTPACPLGSYLQQSAEQAIHTHVPAAAGVEVATVWEPVWDPSMMSPDAKRQLGWGD